MPPRVSIIIPCWNAERFLAETLASVLAQTWTDYELLLVDDGSSDGSWALIADWAARDPRIRPLRLPGNRGVVAARNAALGEARGEWVAFLDSDDRWTPDALARRLTVADAHLDAVLVASDFAWFEERPPAEPVGRVCLGPVARRALAQGYADGRPMYFAEPLALLAQTHIAWTGTILARRAAILAVGGFDERFAGPEDTLLWLKLARRGGLVFLPEVTAFYRQHAASLVHQLREPKEFHYLKVLDWLAQDPEFAARADVFRPIAADCHHVSALHFRALGRWPAARHHAWCALRLAPGRQAHWRSALASWLRR